MMRLVFSGIDSEVILMSFLFDAGLLGFEKGLRWFLSAVGGGRTRTGTVRLSMKKRWFRNLVDGMKGLVCEKLRERTRLD